jgi:hypothetical protein
VIDTGKLVVQVPDYSELEPVGPYYPSMIESVSIRTADGLEPVFRGTPQQGLWIRDDQDRGFSSSRILEESGYVTDRMARHGRQRVTLHETGPLRALLHIEGITGHDTYTTGLEYLVKLECYHQSSLLRFEVVWRHADDQVAHWIKDIRFVLPFSQQPRRVTFGLEQGYLTDRLIPGCAYRVLQQDQSTCLAHRLEPTGQATTVGWGSANGSVAPGWMQARFDRVRASVFMRDFHREYPNEIRIDEDRLELGLWPGDANDRIAAMDILPPHPESDSDAELRHGHTVYDALIARPYWAFFDKDRCCLETVRGMQKGQVFWVDLDPELTDAQCRARAQSGTHEISQARIDSESLRVSSRYRYVYPPANPDQPSAADAAAAWVRNNEAAFNIVGKFDAGDLMYMHFSPGYSKDTDTKHWRRRHHSRISYWNNNEEDPMHGLLLHFLSTGDIDSFRYAVNMARHFLDIDVQHYPRYGVHTHAAGHCFRGGGAASTDHFWCEGLIDYYLLTGDPSVRDVLDGIVHSCTEAQEHLRFSDVDLRSVSILLMQCATYYELLEEPELLERARCLADGLVDEQMPEGHFMNFGKAFRKKMKQEDPENDVRQSFHGFFNTLALEALGRLHHVSPDPKWATAFLRCFNSVREHLLIDGRYVDVRSYTAPNVLGSQYGSQPRPNLISSGQLAMVCPLAWQLSGDETIVALCRNLVEVIEAGILPPEYGPGWAGMGLEDGLDVADILAFDGDGHRIAPTPENFAVQARPLMPSIVLRCLQPVIGWLHEHQAAIQTSGKATTE